MARLKVPWQAVGCAILSLDGAAFEGADDISTVLQCVPSEEEKGVLQVRLVCGFCCCYILLGVQDVPEVSMMALLAAVRQAGCG
jgi:hypothetical protein